MAQLPEGSLGKNYYNFIYKEKLTPDELVSASEINFDPNKTEEENIFIQDYVTCMIYGMLQQDTVETLLVN